MKKLHCFGLVVGACVLLAGCGGGAAALLPTPTATQAPPAPPTPPAAPSAQPGSDPTGTIATVTADGGAVAARGAFFAHLGTNQRSCATCHKTDAGMSISAAGAQALFASSQGADALFDPIDGANCPSVAQDDAAGHSLVLNFGLIRVAREVPAGAQFHIVASQDPLGCAQRPDVATGQPIVAVYRRPLPTTNLKFLSLVMWDGRATPQPLDDAATLSANQEADLEAQAADAVATHEAGAATLTSAQLQDIVAFERSLFTAQESDNGAGALAADGATGGVEALSGQAYTPGAGGPGPIFTLFTAWRNSTNPQQASIARGEDIFNRAPMNLQGIAGTRTPPGAPGHCGTCHSTPNVGSSERPLLLDTGTSHDAASESDPAIRAALAQLTLPTLPVYTVTGCAGNGGAAIATTDPGAALITGRCADMSRVKVPALRGLAARAPYFHNGSAANLAELVDFYNVRFRMGLNPQQRQDLVNFLNAL